ncbi:MAG TPA: hemolysin family protein [Bacteroidota bacterium]
MKPLRQFIKDLLIKGGLLQAQLSEDELKQVLEAGSQSGALDKTEHELIKSIFEFTDTTVKEIMVPRPDIVALDIDTPQEDLLRKVIDQGYSRLPVYKGTIDHIIGIVYSKDLLSMIEHRGIIVLHDLIRPAHFVPESKQISNLLREFQHQKIHMGIVVDEFGGTEGLVTMEDIIEEIVGEIHDEYDEEQKSSEVTSDGTTVVDANISIHDFNEQFNTTVPETADYETLAGFLQKVTGRLPELNEEIQYGNMSFTIANKRGRRLKQIKYKRVARSE